MPAIVRIGPTRYDFGALKHGDLIKVLSKDSALETFRKWRRSTGRRAQLAPSRESPTVLYFIDETLVDSA